MSQTTTPTILITGATGTIGRQLAEQLAILGVPFRALVRSANNTAALAALKGAELVTGDLSDSASLANALKGIRRAFLLTNSSEQAEALQLNFVKAARAAGVEHIVKLSQLAADLHSPVRFLRYHAAVEQAIRQSGMTWTFLRPNLFMQGLLGFSEPIARKGLFFAAIGDARVSLVDTRDIAVMAAAALTQNGHAGKTYDITGPGSLMHHEIAAGFTEVLGKEVRFIDVSPEEMRQAVIGAGFPLWQADGLIEDYAHYARGEAAIVTTAVQEVTGQQPRSFKAFVRDHAAAFS